MDHEKYMKIALEEALKAEALDEVPVGALVVKNGQILSQTHNLRESNHCPTHHAELLAIEAASQTQGAWRLTDCNLYVTLEPCVMCAGAIIQSRVSRVVYGATDPKGGGVKSLYQILEDPRLNHQTEVISGILEQPCSQILTNFFKKKRQQKS